ncbi:NAD(P)-dependent dehydrogenase (short-subunit alcohol dehydrogenase family) [Thermocatellispora tengchongensis]|uniref:NAD(P)-dependent dehydrogenase (Short-subunit alcohol dehydrogenase family) n=1 Tax=Thermocatellispora tengchongensis TaxID=1073253 RepID=A0A840PN99_9ACTN|nr:SDR family oxidoreductase [Thermocatellispora tengchongensis]MBB5139261.1 NAD(P)-dependent dehydrogenase (short-subunit alcohol dehydrogenase family) [Thermocatellispora tengchongensis]
MPDDPMIDPFADAGPLWMAGRTVLVTGGGQSTAYPGVGYAICKVVASHGGRVAVLDRDAEAAERTVKLIERDGGEAISVIADVTSDRACADAVAETVDRLGALDGLVNNVAAGDRSGLFDTTPEHYDRLMTVNLKSAWSITRHAAPVLPRGGSIVNISSVGVRRRGPGLIYCVAKAGLENLTEGAATTLGPQGIRVNCIEVGAIWGAFAARGSMPESMREQRREGTSLKTEGTSWDIAHTALFLLSDRARWVSGQILAVDGGPPHRFPVQPVTSVPMGE